MKSQLQKSIEESEKLRLKLATLRRDSSLEGKIAYNKTLLKAMERQHNIYKRLRLMGDPESTQTADEMEYVAEQYLGKAEEDTFDDFISLLMSEINWQLNLMTGGEYSGDLDNG